MYTHIHGIYRSVGDFTDKETGEVITYDNIVIIALEQLVNKDWKSKFGTACSVSGFGFVPIKDLKCPSNRFSQVFGCKEYNDLMQFVDKDVEIQFDRKGKVDMVKLR
jgi:hypothetical protein